MLKDSIPQILEMLQGQEPVIYNVYEMPVEVLCIDKMVSYNGKLYIWSVA